MECCQIIQKSNSYTKKIIEIPYGSGFHVAHIRSLLHAFWCGPNLQQGEAVKIGEDKEFENKQLWKVGRTISQCKGLEGAKRLFAMVERGLHFECERFSEFRQNPLTVK